MVKRGFFVKKLLLFAVALTFAVVSATSVFAPFTECQVTQSSCQQNEVNLFHLSNNVNAHAQLATITDPQSVYPWNICCKLTGGGQDSLDTSCTNPDTKVTALSSTTNAHVERPGETNYPEDVCLSAVQGTVLCSAKLACNSEERCVFTQSNVTNAHAADCVTDPYTQENGWVGGFENCCRYYPQNCGGLNGPCCAGSCDPTQRLKCENNVCVIGPLVPRCGDFICDAGEADPANPAYYCPQDCGVPGPATVKGKVRNISRSDPDPLKDCTNGCPVPGAAVKVLGKAGAVDTTDAVGYYEIAVNQPSDGSPYDVVASHPDYETSTATGIVLADWDVVQQDFTLVQFRGDCTDDCTKVGSNLCSKDCHGKGFCWFYSQATMDACDGTFGWTELPDGSFVNCCEGKPLSPLKASVSVPCASSVIKTQKIVLYLGKFVKMNILTFVPDLCPTS